LKDSEVSRENNRVAQQVAVIPPRTTTYRSLVRAQYVYVDYAAIVQKKPQVICVLKVPRILDPHSDLQFNLKFNVSSMLNGLKTVK